MDPALRKKALARARLYFVCDAGFAPVELEALLAEAIEGGADLIQLRDKNAPPDALRAAASLFRAAAAEAGVLFILNDDAGLAAESGADGVHVGQDDVDVATARDLAGEAALVGLSTHAADQLEVALAENGASRPDYVSVGPVWETPTKAGRPAAGLDYVRQAAERIGDAVPWFAIGSIAPENVGEVVEAGARRIVVVRAIRDAEDPGAAATELRAALPAGEPAVR